ncbi:hypothetical protein [Acinetobacter pittii]|uniref:hypothetical protein n=1 Tax=Acinetobacter pittii TaxID=48296 RepID=UPI00300950E8
MDLKLVALDTNGILYKDFYSKSLEKFITDNGGVYSKEIDNLLFGAPYEAGGHIISTLCNLPLTPQQTIEKFQKYHKSYISNKTNFLNEGVHDFLNFLDEKRVKVTSYGGSEKKKSFDPLLSNLSNLFDIKHPYIDIGNRRPGITYIVKDIFDLNYNQTLFIDDLSRIGCFCRKTDAHFIGVPSNIYQKELMSLNKLTFFENLNDIKIYLSFLI